jgi:hypothetical protein
MNVDRIILFLRNLKEFINNLPQNDQTLRQISLVTRLTLYHIYAFFYESYRLHITPEQHFALTISYANTVRAIHRKFNTHQRGPYAAYPA